VQKLKRENSFALQDINRGTERAQFAYIMGTFITALDMIGSKLIEVAGNDLR
ncbi:10316_t:CDS:2, partial [Diversispora eburnea]